MASSRLLAPQQRQRELVVLPRRRLVRVSPDGRMALALSSKLVLELGQRWLEQQL